MEELGRAAGERGRRVFRVAELAAGIKELLEEEVGQVWVVGEIGDLFRARSGHCYFTLKDDDAQLRAVLFRGSLVRIPFDPEDGLEVVVQAELGFYEPRGDVQLIVRSLEPRGMGALQLAFEQLRERLAGEGLFDEADKRPLPPWPGRVGIVTSPVGAALQDVIEVTGRRAPGISLLVSPTRVQGAGAEVEIEAALRALDEISDLDVVLLVRGGGSMEDLVAFNSERVARAIRACRRPVVTGVGHEVDVTIADLAADARAPTPSAAAERAVPDIAPWRDRLHREIARLEVAGLAQIERKRGRLLRVGATLRAMAPRTRLVRQQERLEAARHALHRAIGQRSAEPAVRLGELRRRLARALPELVESRSARLAGQVGRLHALSPLAVLSRGFAIVRHGESRAVLRRSRDAKPGETLHLQLGEGSLRARVEPEEEPGEG